MGDDEKSYLIECLEEDLSEREKYVLESRLLEPRKTLRELAVELGVSAGRIYQICQIAQSKIRHRKFRYEQKNLVPK